MYEMDRSNGKIYRYVCREQCKWKINNYLSLHIFKKGNVIIVKVWPTSEQYSDSHNNINCMIDFSKHIEEWVR